MSRLPWKHTVAAVALSAALPAYAAAQNAPDFGPTLEVHLRTLKHGGGVGMSGYANEILAVGAPLTFFLTAGSSNPAELTVCGGGVASVGTLADKLSRNAFVWEVRMLPSKYENGTATFDLEWARYQADGAGRPSAEGKTTMTLREGDRQQIDFVRGVTGSRNCTDDAAVVEVGTGYNESRQLAQSVLQYDLWLKHQLASGQTLTRKFTAMGRQGSGVDFVFAPLRFPAPEISSGQKSYDVVTTVQGAIRGRLLPNGRVEVAVDTSRRDGVATRTAAPGGGSGNGGRKVLDVAADEAVEIELPPPGGSSRVGGQSVDNARFFQGQRTSIIVQVKPVKP
jgi:hypothetical protein